MIEQVPARRAKLSLRLRSDRGVTLLEMMIVLALIALIAGTIGVGLLQKYKRGQGDIARMQIRDLSGNVQHYMISRGGCPSMQELVAHRFVPEEPRDPWGTAIVIRCPGQHDPDGADVLSYGPDKTEGTEDDIQSWRRR
jgi:general secretion pathway protein G